MQNKGDGDRVGDKDNIDDKDEANNPRQKNKNKYSMWQLKQFNIQLWVTIAVLLVPFSIIIWYVVCLWILLFVF